MPLSGLSICAVADHVVVKEGSGHWQADSGQYLLEFEGASSGVLGQDEFDDAGEALEPGTSAAILVYENRWAAPLATALRKNGAQLVANGRIPVNALLAKLDELEAAHA